MKILRSIIPYFALVCLLSLLAFGQQSSVATSLGVALKQGDAKKLAEYMNQTVELLILDNRDVYSKTQAELIVKSFFSEHPPAEFKLDYQSGNTNTKFISGKLYTQKSTYSVYFMLRNTGGKLLVHQMKIELLE